MKPELKSIHSPDVQDLEHYIPKDPENFGFLLEAMIGPKGEAGEESFGIEVCTPKNLEERYGLEDVILGRHFLIVQEYNYRRLVQKIERFLERCHGETWGEVAIKVSQLGRWEFEDYKE